MRNKAVYVALGASPLIGEMGFEPLKPVGRAGCSKFAHPVLTQRLGGSFAAIVRCTVSEVAKLSRLRGAGKGRGPPLGRASDIVGEVRGPTVGDLLDAAQEKLTEAARLLDLSEHRLGQPLLKR